MNLQGTLKIKNGNNHVIGLTKNKYLGITTHFNHGKTTLH